jgi:thioester reductase-like protein
MRSDSTVFLTGFPGFIAGRLLRRLAAEEGYNFVLLVQPALLELAKTEIAEIANATFRAKDDFQILPGDITKPDLGLLPPHLELVRSQTNVIFHLAALYDLAVKRELAVNVNLNGTKHVNDLARSMKNLSHYHYVSTCYVAGKRTGHIFEQELQHEAGFRNHYEESKYLAEIEVDSLKGELPVTIHRPSVVCGDSKTGETAKFDGIYYLVNYLLRWPAGLSLLNIGNKDVSLNLVPVDFVVDALAALATEKQAIGKTLQIADPFPLTTFDLFETIARVVSGRKRTLMLPPGLVEFSLMLPGAPVITHLPHHGVPYFFLKQTYDTFTSVQLLAERNLHCPAFPTYVDKIVEYAAANPTNTR